MTRKIIAGNWKMNGSVESLAQMLEALKGAETSAATVILFPPMPYIGAASVSPVAFGAQDCSAHESGAFTGEVSAKMIAETGAKYVLAGHSERRRYHGEANATVKAKAEQALKSGLTPIICIGETAEERQAGKTAATLEKQVRESIPAGGIIVAYEPVWAIGAGATPAREEIESAHKLVADILGPEATILYGGSVIGGNAADILAIPNVGGVLVGGASLKPRDFIPIIEAGNKS